MGTWVAMVKYSSEVEAQLANSAVAHRDTRVAGLEGAGYKVINWWVSAHPQWDTIFVIEADVDMARDAKFQMLMKGSGAVAASELIPVATPEDVDAVG
ncbi:MAG: hypothetical protein WBM50_05390 [Acidimicrobiales bacterium]